MRATKYEPGGDRGKPHIKREFGYLHKWSRLIFQAGLSGGRIRLMGFRFRRSIRILPGVRLNLSKSGLGISAGPRGLKVGMDARGRKYVSAGIPGTGLSSRQYLKPGAAPASSLQLPAAAEQRDEGAPGSRPYWIAAA